MNTRTLVDVILFQKLAEALWQRFVHSLSNNFCLVAVCCSERSEKALIGRA